METQLNRIESDFAEGSGPFADVQFPEERLLEELPNKSREDRLILISMFSTFDYNRDANRLVDNIEELFTIAPVWFDASKVVNGDEEKLEAVMEKIGFRYPSRDSHAWCKNCRILYENYSGRWTELLLESRLHAPSLVTILKEDDFNCLKGVKIAPMYARIISDEVAEMYDLWQLDIPVDTHIRRLSKDLFNAPNASDDEIRAEWRRVGSEYGVDRHVVDGALWQIGNKWNDWGEDYWNEVTE